MCSSKDGESSKHISSFYHKNMVVLIVVITVLTYGFIKIFYR